MTASDQTPTYAHNFLSLVGWLDASVTPLLHRQILDDGDPDCGGFRSPEDRLASPQGVSSASSLAFAYLIEQSAYFGSKELVERVGLMLVSRLKLI